MDASQFPPQVDEAIIHYIYMDNDLYKAAEAGNMEEFNRYEGDHLRCLVDLMLNTAVHVHTEASGRMVAKTEFSIDFVQQLVAKSPLLLLQPNAKEEIPLHRAAATGNAELVKFIVGRTKELERHEDPENGTESEASSHKMMEMLRMKDEEGNTPLHKAAESGSAQVVQLLMKELDAEFSFSANERGETPLYLASLRGHHESVAEILNNCKSMSMDIDYCGPDGTTALHAAVMSGDESTVSKLIETKEDLMRETDDKGRTPLHYAAHLGMHSIVTELLKKGATAAYIRDKERGSTPLHMAAWQGEFDLMEKIIAYCPGCCNIVDKNGWNFLHFFFVTNSRGSMSYLKKILKGKGDDNKFKDLPMAQLLHQQNIDKITPYEVFLLGPAYRYIVYDKYDADRVSKLFGPYDMRLGRDTKEKEKKLLWESLREISTNVLVAGKQVHISFFRNKEEEEKKQEKKEEEEEEQKKEEQEYIDKTRETHLVVVALITTVTFAAAFTIPGGYNQDKGTAIMSHDSAFKAFLITNTLAFVWSLLAIFFHLCLTFFRQSITETAAFQTKCLLVADQLTWLSMVAMVIAFSTGSYAIMRSSSGFAISTCTLALTPIPVMVLSSKYLKKNFTSILEPPLLR